MKRSRRIVLVSHCLLNVNSKVEGLAEYAGVHPMITELSSVGCGIMQLPCPEMTWLGMKRWGQTLEQYDNPFYVGHCERLADEVALQVAEYVRCDYLVGPVVGFEGSPSCGVNQACSGEWGGEYDDERMTRIRSGCERIDATGVFMRALRERLEPMGIGFDAIDQRESDDGVARLLAGI